PVRWRMAVGGAIAIVLIGGWSAAMWLLPPQFQQWNGPAWYSDGLHAWATKYQIGWLTRYEVQTSVVEQRQADGGALLRRIAQEDSDHLNIPWPVRVSRDSQQV